MIEEHLRVYDLYCYLENHLVRVYDNSGREFVCRPRCLGFTSSVGPIVEMHGLGNDGQHYHLLLTRIGLERGVSKVDDSTVRVYDANDQRVYLEFYTQAFLSW